MISSAQALENQGLNQGLQAGLTLPSPPCAESPELGRRARAPTKPKQLASTRFGPQPVPLAEAEPKSIVSIMCFDCKISSGSGVGELLSTARALRNAAMVRNNSRRMLVSGKHQVNELAYQQTRLQ